MVSVTHSALPLLGAPGSSTTAGGVHVFVELSQVEPATLKQILSDSDAAIALGTPKANNEIPVSVMKVVTWR